MNSTEISLRDQLRQEINETHQAFHQLLNEISDESFSLPSDNPAWTVGEVLYHMSLAPRFLTSDLRMILSQRWLYTLIPVIAPKPLFDWFNKVLTRYGASKLSRQFLANEYDKAHISALRALESLTDQDFQRSINYPDWDPLLSGEVTVERLFRYIKVHFESHAAQIRDLSPSPLQPNKEKHVTD